MGKYHLDKFYTKKDIALFLINQIDLTKYKTIIEPSAGNGSFSSQINNCISYDIEPEAAGIIKEDFLSIDININSPTLIIGNPPFGKNSSLALKFIKKASLFANTIAFILPISFRKISMYEKIPLNFWLEKEINIPKKSFTYKNQEVEIPCSFFIYQKKDIFRIKEEKKQPEDFSFVKKEEANLSFRRVGINAGKCSLDTNKSIQSHYFIYSNNPEVLLNKINNIKWSHENTIGPRSISKQELLKSIMLDKN